jgi:basic membrane lipoprotein Med (substrate-binding protein (PBP1-ABC) superfamily)
MSEQERLGAGSALTRRQVLRSAAGVGLGAVAVGGLAACGSSGASGGSGNGRDLKVAWVMNGPINDGSWETSFADGMKAVQKALPNVKTSYVDNVQFGDSGRQTIMRMAASNDVVFLTTDFGDAQRQAAAAYPNVKFIVCGALMSLPNLLGFYIRNYEIAYVHGVAAGKLTRSNKLGYVASFPVPSVFGDVNGWALGAQSVNPDVEIQVVTISSWYDPQAATQAVDALVSDGADVVWSIMGDNSVPQAAEKRGVWSFAWSRDARRVAPRGYVSTTALDWAPYSIEQVKAVQDGTWRTKPVPGDVLSLGRGGDRGPWGDHVPSSASRAADAARAKLIDGSLNPFEGPIRDASGAIKVPKGKELTNLQLATWNWPVWGVSGLKAGS